MEKEKIKLLDVTVYATPYGLKADTVIELDFIEKKLNKPMMEFLDSIDLIIKENAEKECRKIMKNKKKKKYRRN